MKKNIILFLFVIIASVSLISYSSGADLKQKCNELNRQCLKDCVKKKLKGPNTYHCQSNCYGQKSDCRKNAAKGKKYKWKDPFPK